MELSASLQFPTAFFPRLYYTERFVVIPEPPGRDQGDDAPERIHCYSKPHERVRSRFQMPAGGYFQVASDLALKQTGPRVIVTSMDSGQQLLR